MNVINVLENKSGLSKKQLYVFLGISALWIIGCLCLPLLVSFQPVINFITWFEESFIHRIIPSIWLEAEMTNSMWLETATWIGMAGIVIYFLFFFLFFYNDFFSRILAKKRTVVFVMATVSAVITFIILFHANWVFGDDYVIIKSTATNRYFTFSDNIFIGRFFPLTYMHYNVPFFITRRLGMTTGLPVEAHFAFLPVFFIMSYVCLYSLFNKIEPFRNRKHPVLSLFFASTFFLLGNTFFVIFMFLILPETPGIMLFSIFMLMYYKALETDKIKYYVIALLAAAYNTYCKEPVFGVFLVIAFTNHLFRYKKESKRERIFYTGLIVNAVLFLVLYYFFSYRNTKVFYNSIVYEKIGETVDRVHFLITNPILIIIFLFGLIRLYYITIKKDRKHLYYDSLLFAGIAYTFAYIALKMTTNDYYFMPSIILFLPSLVYWTKYMYEKKRKYALCLFFMLVPIYVYNSGWAAITTKAIWKERQEFTPYITNLLSEYNSDKEFVWYREMELDSDWEKNIYYFFLNYFNKSAKTEFFTVENRALDSIDLKQNTLLFIPLTNNSLPPREFRKTLDEFIETLQENNFELYNDRYNTLIYKQ